MTATVLGIRVTDAQLARWRGWVMPPVQPFLLTAAEAQSVKRVARSRRLTPELRDTFQLYALPGTGVSAAEVESSGDQDQGDDVHAADDAAPHSAPDVARRPAPIEAGGAGEPQRTSLIWLDRRGARLLSPKARAAQPTKHRWPGKHPERSRERDTARTIRWIEDGLPASQHSEVSEATWRRARAVLPEARRIAGRFPARSGPNCFGMVMGAAGADGAEKAWMQRESFERWLRETTITGGNDDNPGTVLVWRGIDGAAEHAAITLGDGWLLNKATQSWCAPVTVLPVREGINASRAPGRRLERHTIA
ncbi:hypothetical protein [Microbacterium sp. ZW T5_56]|uniref:hypothetical protein n=1 Tax=Microbacterium sp. ZW T5_56 TaxID=3378081 RepID=UPI00385280E6